MIGEIPRPKDPKLLKIPRFFPCSLGEENRDTIEDTVGFKNALPIAKNVKATNNKNDDPSEAITEALEKYKKENPRIKKTEARSPTFFQGLFR